MTVITESAEAATAPTLIEHGRGWLIALGIVQIILGAVALSVPVIASFAAVAVFGAVLLMNAICQMIHAVNVRSWARSTWYGLGGVLYAIAGLFVVIHPIAGALTLALTIAALSIADGILRIVFAAANRSVAGWGWLVAAGIGSGAVGIILLVGWPATALWATGLLFGLNLLFIGATQTALALTTRADGPPKRRA